MLCDRGLFSIRDLKGVGSEKGQGENPLLDTVPRAWIADNPVFDEVPKLALLLDMDLYLLLAEHVNREQGNLGGSLAGERGSGRAG